MTEEDFPGGSDGKASVCNARDQGSIPGWGRFPGEGNGYPLWYYDLENSMDCIVHGVAKSWIRLSNFQFFTWCHRELLVVGKNFPTSVVRE